MSYGRYVRDKRYFIIFYVTTMAFVSLVMFAGSPDAGRAAGNILYANAGCLFFAACYVTIGYFYRHPFYAGLKDAAESESEEPAAGIPDAQNNGQALCLEAFMKLAAVHSRRLQRSAEEQRDRYEFIMSWIHEVKLPIAASRLLLENGAEQPSGQLIDRLEDELGKIDHYVEQALYYTRIDSFSNDYFITEVPLERIVKDTVKKYAKLFITKRIAADIRLGGTPATVHSDGKWLAYIVDQLVANALKYTPENGRIGFRCEEDGSGKRLVVTDTGIGILPEDIGRVFEKGFTGANGRQFAKSTGMGLYLARQLALKLGHELSVVSEPGVSTSATVHFPKLRSYYPGR